MDAPIWSQADHDLLIEVRTTLNQLVNDIKQYNTAIMNLELRVRALENTKNETVGAIGGWRMILLVIGSFGGIFSGIIALISFLHR